MKHSGLLALCFLLAGLCAAQQYEVTVTSITVWVKVLDSKGNTVTGLSQDDFEIYEDNQKVPASCFEEVRLTAQETAPAQTQVEVTGSVPAQKFVLFLDLLNMTPAEYRYIRPRLQQFLDQARNGNYEVMLAALLANGKLGIVAPFSKDMDRARKLLDQAGAKANPGRDQTVVNNRRQITQTLETILDDPRFYDTGVQSAYRLAQAYAKEEKNTTLFSLSALESFSSHLVSLTSNEHVVIVYVSGGFNLEPGKQYFEMVTRFAEKQGDSQSAADLGMKFPASIRESNFDVRDEIETSVGRLNRNNVTLYSINTRGTIGPGVDPMRASAAIEASSSDVLKDYQDSLGQIAKETGGTSFENTNNFRVGLDRVLSDLDQQYVLCYSPPPHKEAGKYHKIKIVCKRPGVSVRHRLGYTD